MRMWMIPARLMCRKHLLGEHVELHMLAGSIRRGKNIDGFLHGLVMPNSIEVRHRELVAEMKRRGYNHQSPLTQPRCPPGMHGFVDPEESKRELRRRCDECRVRQETEWNSRGLTSSSKSC